MSNARSDDAVRIGIFKAILATAAYAGLHSALASGTAKDAAERLVGTRRRNAFYRPMFNVVAVVTTTALIGYVWKLPDRRLYRVNGPPALLMRFGQLLSLAYLGWTAFSQDTAGFIGLPQLWAFITGKKNVPREPASQGPSFDESKHRIAAVGPFKQMRQPANAAFIPLLWLNPTMTAKWAAFNAGVTLYSIVGSIHAEKLLRDAYGPAYERYQKRVPMLVPAMKEPRTK